MKARFGFALLLLGLLGIGTGKTLPSFAQQTARVSLELDSTTVWLGMPKKDVLKKLSDASFTVTEPHPDSIVTWPQSTAHVYSLRFRNGLLIYADREWYTNGSEEIDAILGGIGSLADQSMNRPCNVCTIRYQNRTFQVTASSLHAASAIYSSASSRYKERPA